MTDTATFDPGKLLPSERAYDAAYNMQQLLRTHTGPDDAAANVALQEGGWLVKMLAEQVRRETEAVAMIAQHLYGVHTGKLVDDATPEEEARFMQDARATFQLAGVGYNA